MERILIILIPLLLNVFAFCYHPENIQKRQDNIYPSIDPSVFEVRYPDTDIQGRVVI